MIPVKMIVHNVKLIAENRNRNVRIEILAGDHRFHAAFLPQKLRHFPIAGAVRLIQETPEVPVHIGDAASGKVVLRGPLIEFFLDVWSKSAAVPPDGEVVFIDQIHIDKSGIFRPGHSGIGIPMGHPFPGKCLPVVERRFAERNQNFEGNGRTGILFIFSKSCISGMASPGLTFRLVKRSVVM